MKNNLEVRDPIHGAISISVSEKKVIDSREFQRLRYIKQTGLADFAFPGATHTRYTHSLGAMYFASSIFDYIFDNIKLGPEEKAFFRQCVRLAALLHDIGHAPLSHSTEQLMPMLSELNVNSSEHRRATHEDYTHLIITNSDLAALIEKEFAYLGLSPAMVASLLNNKTCSEYFIKDGVDYAPVLSQIISSEVDADRMDYLLRDSLYCGVNYGKFDHQWLVGNLRIIKKDKKAYLGIFERGIFALEDFLLSRYHMFASVYLHRIPVVMEKMLERYFLSSEGEFYLPSKLNDYILLNDMDLWQTLRQSSNKWAKRITERMPFMMIEELHSGYGHKHDKDEGILKRASYLKSFGIDIILSCSKSILSDDKTDKFPVFVENNKNDIISLKEFSMIFSRYHNPVEILRIYIDENDQEKALKILENV